MSDSYICPRTGEVCRARQILADDLEAWKEMEANAIKTNQSPFFGKADRFLSTIMPGRGLIFEPYVKEAGERVAQREAALAINCVIEDSCVVREAMKAMHIVD